MEFQQLLRNLVSLGCRAIKTSKLLEDGIPTIAEKFSEFRV
jgi:hypothetical protein